MSRHRLAVVFSLFAACALLTLGRTSGQDPTVDGFGPLSPPAQPPNVTTLSPAEQLGKDIFFDSTLSNPPGYSCATCHVPSTGFTGPNSSVNAELGTMPGVIPGRFGKRKPQAVPYSSFSPRGPIYDDDLDVWLGGNFWDGRAMASPMQSRMPFLDPNEMANVATGPMPPHSGGFSSLVAQKLRRRPYSGLFEQVFGVGTLAGPDALIYQYASLVIADYEASRDVNRFNSKFDASRYATSAQNGINLSPSETNGLFLFFGKAQCSACHSSAPLNIVQALTGGKNVFTMYCYANIGVPRNPGNPFYRQTDPTNNPFGSNPDGANFVDLGLAGNPNPTPDGSRFFNARPGDLPQFRGLFKAPSVRNADKRPNGGFVKAYMHNGVFKSLEEVVHFYNTRNIAVNKYGHPVSFDLRVGPPPGYTRLQPPPEVMDNVQNVAGVSPAHASDDDAVATNGQVGNLGLTPSEEADIVNFLKTLSDQ